MPDCIIYSPKLLHNIVKCLSGIFIQEEALPMADVRPESLKRITTKALADQFIDEQIKAIKEQVGDKKVLLALSGGVDSSVVAALLIKAIGTNLVFT